MGALDAVDAPLSSLWPWVAPRLSLWLCGAPWSWSLSWPFGASLVIVVGVYVRGGRFVLVMVVMVMKWMSCQKRGLHTILRCHMMIWLIDHL